MGAELRDFAAIDLLFIVQGDDPGEAQDRLAQPAQPEQEQQRSYDAEQEVLRNDRDDGDAKRTDDQR